MLGMKASKPAFYGPRVSESYVLCMLRIYISTWHELISNPGRAMSPPACLPFPTSFLASVVPHSFVRLDCPIAPTQCSTQCSTPFLPPNPNPQRPLIPQRKQRIRLLPLPLQNKRPQQLRKHEPHLAVRDVLPDAVARAEREGVESGR